MAAPKTLRRLTTWKEIAAYIHRDTRTAKRYEAERGLPVHRMPGESKSVVFAYVHEIDGWLQGGGTPPEKLTIAPAAEPPPSAPTPVTSTRDRRMAHRRVIAAALIIICGTLAGGSWALRIAQASPPVGGTEASSENPDAQALYLKGRFAWDRRTGDELKNAAEDFSQAIRIDPKFAGAYVGLADSYNLMPQFGGMPPEMAGPLAVSAAERAVALAPRSAAAHRALAFAALYWDRDVAKGNREFEYSLVLDPASAQTHHWYANALAAEGDSRRALDENAKAETLDPTNISIKADKGWVLYMNGRNADALSVLKEVEAIHPDYAMAFIYEAAVYDALGMPQAMMDRWRRAAAINGDRYLTALAAAGEKAMASDPKALLQSVTDRAEELYAAGEGSPFNLAVYEMRLGRTDQALAHMEDCIRRRDPAAVAIPTTRLFRPLDRDARFQRIVAEARKS